MWVAQLQQVGTAHAPAGRAHEVDTLRATQLHEVGTAHARVGRDRLVGDGSGDAGDIVGGGGIVGGGIVGGGGIVVGHIYKCIYIYIHTCSVVLKSAF